MCDSRKVEEEMENRTIRNDLNICGQKKRRRRIQRLAIETTNKSKPKQKKKKEKNGFVEHDVGVYMIEMDLKKKKKKHSQ